MKRIEKILAVLVAVVFALNHLAYANSFTDWFTTRKPGSAAHFFQKTVYKDRIYNVGYKKVFLPAVGRSARAFLANSRRSESKRLSPTRESNSIFSKVKNFFVKSVYQDRMYGFAYKKVFPPLAVLTGNCISNGVPPAPDTVGALKNHDSEYLKQDRSYHQEPIIDFFKTLPRKTYNHIVDLKKAGDKGGIIGLARAAVGKLVYGEKWMANDVVRYQTHSVPGTNSWTQEEWSGMINPNSREVANAEQKANIDIINSGQSWQYSLEEVGFPTIDYVYDSSRYVQKRDGDWWQKPDLTLKADQGDCDDNAIMNAAILDKLGQPYRVITGFGPRGGHAWVETKDNRGNRWVIDFDGAYPASSNGGHWDLQPRTMFSRTVQPRDYVPDW